jgi:hypothetical protein
MLDSLRNSRRPFGITVLVAALVAIGALIGGLGTSAATEATSPEAGMAASKRARQLAQARRATARFKDVEVAKAAGFREASPCVATAAGGMGIHYNRDDRMDDTIVNHRRPEQLLYEPTADGGRRLVGVEYHVRESLVIESGGRVPRVFGKRFDGPMDGHGPGEPRHYDIHVWLHKRNPSGMFKQYNPRVTCTPPAGY